MITASPPGPIATPRPLLSVRDLRVSFKTRRGELVAVDNVSFHIGTGEVVGLVGESGSGKSVTALAIARLLREPPATVSAQELTFDGVGVLTLTSKQMRAIRGSKISFVFQDPLSSLNPVMKVGDQIAEIVQAHLGLHGRTATNRVVELLDLVGIPRAKSRLHDYPHQFSGGMRQRVMVAIAVACNPKLIIADEPTTALDVTIQAQILELLAQVVRDFGASVLLITHDLGIAAGTCDRVHVMYAGQIAEIADVDALFDDPRAPYTRGLLEAIPRLDEPRDQPLRAVRGSPPDLIQTQPACRFAPRCDYARPQCLTDEPQLVARDSTGHLARCWATEPGGWLP